MDTPYTLTQSRPPKGDCLLRIAEGPRADRARVLALSQDGRWVPGLSAFVMHPSRAAKFCVLFDAGWTARRHYYGAGCKPWRYSRGEHVKLRPADAIRISRLTLDVSAGEMDNTLTSPARMAGR